MKLCFFSVSAVTPNCHILWNWARYYIPYRKKLLLPVLLYRELRFCWKLCFNFWLSLRSTWHDVTWRDMSRAQSYFCHAIFVGVLLAKITSLSFVTSLETEVNFCRLNTRLKRVLKWMEAKNHISGSWETNPMKPPHPNLIHRSGRTHSHNLWFLLLEITDSLGSGTRDRNLSRFYCISIIIACLGIILSGRNS